MVCVTDVDGKLFPLGGNMRLKALQELKYKEIPDEWVMLADEWTEEKRQEFVIKDNVGFGEWDWEYPNPILLTVANPSQRLTHPNPTHRSRHYP